MIIPLAMPGEGQFLTEVTRGRAGLHYKRLLPVQFVPLLRDHTAGH